MSMLDDPTQVLQRLIAPELRELNERLDGLETRLNEYESRTESRFQEIMNAVQRITEWTTAQDRNNRRDFAALQLE